MEPHGTFLRDVTLIVWYLLLLGFHPEDYLVSEVTGWKWNSSQRWCHWVPWKGARDSSGDFSGPVYYQGQEDLMMTPSKSWSQLSSSPWGAGDGFSQGLSMYPRKSPPYFLRLLCSSFSCHLESLRPGNKHCTVRITQGCTLLTALQDPHQQEKRFACHLPFKMTEVRTRF